MGDNKSSPRRTNSLFPTCYRDLPHRLLGSSSDTGLSLPLHPAGGGFGDALAEDRGRVLPPAVGDLRTDDADQLDRSAADAFRTLRHGLRDLVRVPLRGEVDDRYTGHRTPPGEVRADGRG